MALIRDEQLSDDQLAELLPGPDFPGGAQIISTPAEIREAYRGGRGSLKVRARWQVEELARGQWQLIVTELPPGTSAQKVLEEIEELTNPKIKAGKKALSADQTQLKAAVLAVLDAVRDESSKDAPVRLVFEPKSRSIEVQELVTTLLAHTSLESSVPMNLTMIGADGRPTQKGLRQILTEWVGFRQETVRRRTADRLERVGDRIHVLEGRQLVLLNIDEVIRIIRESDEPKPALIARFALSDRQAEDILEIRLRQLARLEAIQIEQELSALRGERDRLREILDSASVLRRTVIREIEADAKQYGDDRRTLIQADKRAVAEVKVPDEPVTVVVSTKGWVRVRQGHGHDRAAFAFKAGDGLLATFECRSVDPLLVFADNGRVHSVPVSALPGSRGDGQPITTLIELEAGSKPLHFLAAAADVRLLLAHSGATGLIALVGDLISRNRTGKAFLTLEAGELPLAPVPIPAHATELACLAESGRLLVFALSELRHQPNGGRGLALMAVDVAADPLRAVLPFSGGLHLTGTGRGAKPREDDLKGVRLVAHAGKRGRNGVPAAGFVRVESMSALG